MAFEIPTALIHQLQISLREEAGIGFYDPDDSSLPPPPSVEDAVAALDPDLPSSLRCARCQGGLLRGLSSPLCIYCGERRSGEGVSDTISFRCTTACRLLLDSLGLDGSEPIMLDTESMDSIKGRDTQKSELVLSDLLDLELRWRSKREGDTQSSANKESTSSEYALNLSAVDLDSFFTETKKDLAPDASASGSGQYIQERHISRKNHTFSGPDDFDLSENFQSSGSKDNSLNTKNSESSHSFTDWDAEFQSASSESFAADSKSVDLFRSHSVTKSLSDPNVAPTFDKTIHTQLEKNSTGLGIELPDVVAHPLTNNKFVQGDLWPRKNTELDKDLDVGTGSTDETNSSELKVSSGDNWVQGDLLFTNSRRRSENTGNGHDTLQSFDAHQDFSRSGEPQGGLPNLEKQTATTPQGHSSETKSMDPWPTSSTNIVDNAEDTNYDESFDDWQDFATSGQTQGSLSNIPEEIKGMPFESPAETKSMDQLPTRNTWELVEAVNEDEDSFDDWQDFASSGPLRETLPNIREETRGILEHPPEIKSTEQPPASNIREFTESISENHDFFDDYQNFASFDQAQETLSNIGEQTQGMSLEHTSEIKSANLWPTSSIKEFTESITEKNNFVDDWQDLASSGQAQGCLSNQGEEVAGTSFEHPPESKSIDMWPTSSIKGLGESVDENNDSFGDWHDFTSSGQAQESLSKPWGQVGASFFEYSSGSKQNELQGSEFGSFMHFDSFSKAPDEKKDSNEANGMLFEALTFDRTNDTNQMIVADPFSAFGGSMDADHVSTAKPEPPNVNLEALLSQMHDLSFMLKDELSIPDKPGSFKSNS
ncbi:uncharacterized protein [Typha angustifolia]|uniref:uncharacterized protein n=1 Tax=Typha angustifolia TaxID=59011 RepID=UPI003C2B6C3F